MIKKIYFVAVLVAILMAVASCSGLWEGVDLTDQRSVDRRLRADIAKCIPDSATVFEIRLNPSANFSKRVDVLSVTFFDRDSQAVRCRSAVLTGDYAPREVPVDPHLRERTAGGGVPLAAVDLSRIAANVAAGAKMMAAAGKPFSGIGSYTVTLDADSAAVEHRFTLDSKVVARSGVIGGGRQGVTTEYCTFDFAANSRGDVVHVGE